MRNRLNLFLHVLAFGLMFLLVALVCLFSPKHGFLLFLDILDQVNKSRDLSEEELLRIYYQ